MGLRTSLTTKMCPKLFVWGNSTTFHCKGIVRETLKKILLRVQTQHYGQHPLYTSGPCVLGEVVTIRSMPGMTKEKNAFVKQSIIVTVPFSDNTSN